MLVCSIGSLGGGERKFGKSLVGADRPVEQAPEVEVEACDEQNTPGNVVFGEDGCLEERNPESR